MRSQKIYITKKSYPLNHFLSQLCSRKMYRCESCGKTFSRKNNMKRHQVQTCKDHKQNIVKPTSIIQPNKDKIVGDILNKVIQRVDMDVKPIAQKIPTQPPKKLDLPLEVVNNIKPKSLNDIAIEVEQRKATPNLTDIETSDEESEPDSDMDISDSKEQESDLDDEFMPDNPEDLKKEFKQLFNKLHNNVEIYNKLVFMLDEMKRMNCLTKEECNAMNKCLQEKIGI